MSKEQLSKFWTDWVSKIDVENFRASPHYLCTKDYDYQKMYDSLVDSGFNKFDLEEDGVFGCETVKIGDVTVSRDLLDSAFEIKFLYDQLGEKLSGSYILDIGSGYGRFAHRFTTAFPESKVFCVDAVQLSRNICRRYLSHRNCKNAFVVGANEDFEDVLLAVNIHSWSECTMEAVTGWLDKLVESKIPYLFVVPHTDNMGVWDDYHGGSQGPSYRPELEKRGYVEIAMQKDPMGVVYYLFWNRSLGE